MTAAVADYRVAHTSKNKLKKTRAGFDLKLILNPDILATLSNERRGGQVVIGFALEDRAGRTNAKSKLTRKKLDAIVLNQPSAIGADRNTVDVLTRSTAWTSWPNMTKQRLAERLIRLVEQLCLNVER